MPGIMADEPMEVDSVDRGDQIVVQYSNHLEEIQKILQDGSASIEAVQRVGQIINSTNELALQEQTLQQSILGSETLQLCTQVAVNQTCSLDTNLCNFDPNNFAFGVKNFIMDPDQDTEVYDWMRLAQRVCRLYKRTVPFSYMYGSFKPTELPPKEPKERQARQRRQAELAAKKQPEKLTRVEATDEGNEKSVKHILKCLKNEFRKRNNKPVGVFEFVVDPSSYCLTVENIFRLSFLVRDYKVRIEYEDKMPMLHLCSDNEAAKIKSGKKQQCIFAITVAQWQELVQVYRITEPAVTPLA